MARRLVPRYEKFTLTPVDMETIEEGTVATFVIRTNIPLSWLTSLKQDNAETARDFLLNVIKEWDGMDLPLDRDGIGELVTDEVKAIVDGIMRCVGNPQRPPNGSTP